MPLLTNGDSYLASYFYDKFNSSTHAKCPTNWVSEILVTSLIGINWVTESKQIIKDLALGRAHLQMTLERTSNQKHNGLQNCLTNSAEFFCINSCLHDPTASSAATAVITNSTTHLYNAYCVYIIHLLITSHVLTTWNSRTQPFSGWKNWCTEK